MIRSQALSQPAQRKNQSWTTWWRFTTEFWSMIFSQRIFQIRWVQSSQSRHASSVSNLPPKGANCPFMSLPAKESRHQSMKRPLYKWPTRSLKRSRSREATITFRWTWRASKVNGRTRIWPRIKQSRMWLLASTYPIPSSLISAICRSDSRRWRLMTKNGNGFRICKVMSTRCWEASRKCRRKVSSPVASKRRVICRARPSIDSGRWWTQVWAGSQSCLQGQSFPRLIHCRTCWTLKSTNLSNTAPKYIWKKSHWMPRTLRALSRHTIGA